MNQKKDLGILRHTVTRRQVVAGLAVGACGGLNFQASTALAATEEQLSHSQESFPIPVELVRQQELPACHLTLPYKLRDTNSNVLPVSF